MQGLTRHYAEAHNRRPCFNHNCNFTYGRRYEGWDHIVNIHPDTDPVTILGEDLRKRTTSTTCISKQGISTSAVPQDQQDLVESQPRSFASPSPAEVRDTNVSSAIPSVADDL